MPIWTHSAAADVSTATTPLSGAAPPVSGGAGVPKGKQYIDTSTNPPTVYENVGDAVASSWMSLLSGNVV